MTSVGDGTRNQKSGGPWFAIGFFLAVGATFALVFTDDHRWLRMGILAALWAALAGSFVAMKYRKQMVSDRSSLVRAQEIYELELEREIAARREFELETETQTRQRVAEDSQEEIEALRTEVFALRENLQALFGGEVLWERVALTAQSTRMRSLQEEPYRLAPSAPGNAGLPVTAAANTEHVVEHPTQVLGRVQDRAAAASPASDPGARIASAAHGDSERSSGALTPPAAQDDAVQQQNVQQPRRGRVPPQRVGSAMARASAGVDRARARTVENRMEQDRSLGEHDHDSQPASAPVGRTEHDGTSSARSEGERGPAPSGRQHSEPSSPSPATRQFDPPRFVPAPPSSAPSPAQGQLPLEQTKPAMDQVPRGHSDSADTPTAHQFANASIANGGGPFMSEENPGADRTDQAADSNSTPGPHASAPAAQKHEHGQPETNWPVRSALNPQADEQPERPGGRRRRAEPDAEAVPTTSFAEAESSASDGLTEQQDEYPHERQKSEEDGISSSESDGRSSRGESESSGAHSTGRSVNELLAAHGVSTTPRRRRRRAED